MSLPYKYIHQVDENKVYHDEEVIEALAELAGFNVYEVKGFNDEHKGYVIEPQDPELHEFIAAENAVEQHENEVVSAMGSYFEEEA